ncbi:carboxy-S-adenosyl-L-methionine synthase CmoA [Oceanicoccus sp. KOV_DT_Chl]|uniref:carboxy-S-adenosyl-L-methionine synthase CmoA n=1 Tax=Oceanicoccus sp. KOV_DT_Chl TaxID=1904639 RepID=UPI000C7CFD84|nr:carboxy-S-adenosyl-L-methionine synthase CmoA [Oceanicoccus sp. KOV_DT_Chl]
MSNKDAIYSKPLEAIADFSFDDKVVQVFPDMIQRSVPGYSTIIAMTGVMAARYAQAGSFCYDLGSSLGASTLSLRQQLEHAEQKPAKIIAVDNSAAMQQRCQQIIAQDTSSTDVELVENNIQDVVIENASVVVLNFTLQFINIAAREALLQKIFNGMRSGGILILSEKFCFDDPHLQQLNTDLHHSFKRANGYSDMEISQKRTALEKVLLPETINTHQQRLKDVGFSSNDVWFQCFNFASLVAIK